MAKSGLKTLDSVKEWFDRQQSGSVKRPYFTIYRGHDKNQSKVVHRNEDFSDAADAWEIVESTLEPYTEDGGDFLLFLTEKPAGNIGPTCWINFPVPYGGGGNRNHNVAGIFGIYGNPKDYLDAEIEKAKKVMAMEREIEDLKAMQDAKVGVLDRIMENIVERPEIYQLIQMAGMKILGNVGVQQQPLPAVSGQSNEAETKIAESDGYDYERVEPALDRLRKITPDVESTIEKLAAWASKNPEMARQMLETI